jgi:hypothetical protein
VEFALVVAGRDAAELLQVADQPCDGIALPVRLAIEVRVLGLVGAARDDRFDALATERPEQSRGRVRLVRDHRRGL